MLLGVVAILFSADAVPDLVRMRVWVQSRSLAGLAAVHFLMIALSFITGQIGSVFSFLIFLRRNPIDLICTSFTLEHLIRHLGKYIHTAT